MRPRIAFHRFTDCQSRSRMGTRETTGEFSCWSATREGLGEHAARHGGARSRADARWARRHYSPITSHESLLPYRGVGRGCGVGRGLGVALGVAVGVGVTVAVAVGVTVAVGVAVGVGVGVGPAPDRG